MGEVEHIIHGERGSLDLTNIQHHTRNAHLIEFFSGFSVLNLHGVAGGKKLDSPEREIQTDRILKIVKSCKTPLIICGDFNLAPDSNALLKLEKLANLENWIKKSKIDSTRSSLYPKRQRYADYILTTKCVQCNKFSTPNLKISDHLPLVFYFSIDR